MRLNTYTLIYPDTFRAMLLLVLPSSYFFNKNCSFQLFGLICKTLMTAAAEEAPFVWGEFWGLEGATGRKQACFKIR